MEHGRFVVASLTDDLISTMCTDNIILKTKEEQIAKASLVCFRRSRTRGVTVASRD